jgi:DNA-binding GntR family transcriptional regulator
MLHEHLRNRIRTEYLEMPGLRLTSQQVQRLCGIERTVCQMVLDSLVDEKFLCVKSNGHYALSTDGEIPYPRAAKADLRPEQRLVKAS